ncbi:MAG: glycosyltransferase family 39 protein [Chloroflexi bacterium]|nr:glycosyltransferase family 39 protein [Chloroflexota bacterium]
MNRRSALLIIIVMAVAVRLASALTLGDRVVPLPGIFDQLSYQTLATRVLDGYGFTFAVDWWPLTKAGAPTAHWSYIYTLFLTAVYSVFGVHPLVARMLQATVAGALMPWLVWRIGRRAFGDSAGMVGAAWAAVYGYLVYYSGALMTETFYILGILWMLDCAARVAEALNDDTATGWHWLELGVAIGLTALLRQVILVFVPVLLLWLAWAALGYGKNLTAACLRALVGGVLVTGVATALLIAPATIYNYSRFGRFVLLNSNAGFAFFWANHPIYGDHFVPLLTSDMPGYDQLVPAELRSLDEAALDSALLERGLQFVLDDPGRYLRLSISRLPVYFMFWPSSESGLLSNLVRVASFGVALPLILLGLVLWLSRPGRGRSLGLLLALFALTYSAVHLLSWTLIRYRLPVDAVMLIFAGYGLFSLWARFGLPWPANLTLRNFE